MKIKEMRLKTKTTQSEFSKLCNIPLRTIQKWERGGSKPAQYLLDLIEKYIDSYQKINVEKYIRKPQTTFAIINKNTFTNNSKIHPLQQTSIEAILETLKKYKEVIKVIVFGSSTTEKCNYDSDIDIYVELSKNINVKTFKIEKPVDFWTNYTINDEMLKEIRETGVVVYAR